MGESHDKPRVAQVELHQARQLALVFDHQNLSFLHRVSPLYNIKDTC